MSYVTRPVCGVLAHLAESIGVQESLERPVPPIHDADAPPRHPPTAILPTGTAELVFHYGDRFEQARGRGWSFEPDAYVTPQRLAPLTARATDRTGVVVVTLHPWSIPTILGAPARALDETTIDLRHFFGAGAVDALLGRIAEAHDAEHRMALVEAFISDRMGIDRMGSDRMGIDRMGSDRMGSDRMGTDRMGCDRMRSDRMGCDRTGSDRMARARRIVDVDPVVRHAVLRLSAAFGGLRVEALAEEIGVSRRQLDRRFVEHVGIAPKAFARVVRFQRALALLHGGESAAGAAAGAGYHDQPHMQREFRLLADRTPRSIVARRDATPLMSKFNQRGVSRFYNTMYLH